MIGALADDQDILCVRTEHCGNARRPLPKGTLDPQKECTNQFVVCLEQ